MDITIVASSIRAMMFCRRDRDARHPAATENRAPHGHATHEAGEHAHARGNGHDRDVTVRHVAQLVGQDRFEFFVVESLHESSRVAQMTACLGLRPVAKALGISISATPTRGFSMLASRQRRSTISCSFGS
jgi:hypothetical protein